MRKKFVGVMAALIGLSILAVDADARRMSGGKNIGRQREAINPNQAAPRTPAQQPQQANPSAAPTQQQAAPAAAGAATQKQSGMSRWLGPLAGLALGAGLASLFFNNGLGGALMGILLMAALIFGAVLLFRLIRGSKRNTEPLRYAGATPAGSGIPPSPAPAAPAPTPYRLGGAAAHSVAATTQSDQPQPVTGQRAWPADFDAEQFLRHARLNFSNLQAAHDRRDLTAIRDFLTPGLYRDIEADVNSAGAPQKTDIVALNAEVLDVTTENGLYIVSVRFSGMMRDEADAEAQPFNEVWHLEKPVNGRSGWLVSGIQQA